MDKKNAIVAIVGAVLNIAAIITRAFGLTDVSEVLYEIGPEVNTVVIALLIIFGYERKLARLK